MSGIDVGTTKLRPGIHGWRFINRFSWDVPILGKRTIGLCGGMCATVPDYYFNGDIIDKNIMTFPNEGERLYNTPFRRQVDTLRDWVWKYV